MYREKKEAGQKATQFRTVGKTEHQAYEVPGVLIGTPGLREGGHSLMNKKNKRPQGNGLATVP